MRALLALTLALAACGPNETHPRTVTNPFRAGGETPLACIPNLDGSIDANELPVAADVAAQYLISSEPRAVNVAGVVDASGRRVWDWSRSEARDRDVRIGPLALAGQWYGGAFAEASFAAPLDAAGSTHGVYRRSENAVLLLGIASAKAEPASARTLLVYDPPIVLYRLPMAPGDAWTSTGKVTNGTLGGLPYNGRDTYEVRVDGAGRLELPDLSLAQVLRVRTRVTVAPAAGAATIQRQVSFVSECLGEVARATAPPGDGAEDFTTAAEVRRLGLE